MLYLIAAANLTQSSLINQPQLLEKVETTVYRGRADRLVPGTSAPVQFLSIYMPISLLKQLQKQPSLARKQMPFSQIIFVEIESHSLLFYLTQPVFVKIADRWNGLKSATEGFALVAGGGLFGRTAVLLHFVIYLSPTNRDGLSS
jgi:hypothetical protein